MTTLERMITGELISAKDLATSQEEFLLISLRNEIEHASNAALLRLEACYSSRNLDEWETEIAYKYADISNKYADISKLLLGSNDDSFLNKMCHSFRLADSYLGRRKKDQCVKVGLELV